MLNGVVASMQNSVPSMLKKEEKQKLAEKIGFMKSEEISEEMKVLREHFGIEEEYKPHTDLKYTRKIFDSKIGQINDELVLMRDEEDKDKE